MIQTLFVQFLPAEGREKQVKEVLEHMVAQTRQEPGNLTYDLYQSTSPDGRQQYNLIEHYADEAAIAAHRASGYYQQFQVDIAPLVAAPILLVSLSPVNVA
jgi:quinol monooxygenase YgiN